MRSALALRTAIVTAAVAGTLLAPAATSAFAAATAPQTALAAAATSVNGRYEGTPVYIGEGLVAVLRNKAEGPEAWIRYVGTDWKPGDVYMVRVMDKLDRTHTSAVVSGLELKLTKADTAVPVLTVTTAGVTKSYPLPAGEATTPASCVSPVKTVKLGEYRSADLTMSPQGPKAFVHNLEGDPAPLTLDRTHPKGPDADTLRIENPSGAAPVLRWKYQAGDPAKSASFPALPKGCKAEYPVKDDEPTTPADKCVSEIKQVQVGNYLYADLTMSPQGPKAFVHDTESESDPWTVTLTRTNPTGTPQYYLHIANASGAAPVMEWKTQGGDSPVFKASFPALPKGCKAAYEVHDDAAPKPTPAATPAASSNVSTQTKGQTTVVPQGAVAAGAEIPVATVADTDDTTTLAAGAGLLAIFAALGTVALRRRRSNV
ncbi:hypothetical protein [Streptomyces sp. NBC_00503]|uniref:hypothetical protein n=1 Tax=Streptomyces sp. NBC_00503 TaxID=2903659 RepID=UPI002E80F2FE|nr:hypothetical protein [Streptomyces sp. NBC_00503]WUD83244.1 hypothetical protein OG490_23290 [Streptomyces sp. NBC_00503]